MNISRAMNECFSPSGHQPSCCSGLLGSGIGIRKTKCFGDVRGEGQSVGRKKKSWLVRVVQKNAVVDIKIAVAVSSDVAYTRDSSEYYF